MTVSAFKFNNPVLTHLEYEIRSENAQHSQEGEKQIPVTINNRVQHIDDTTANVSLSVQVANKDDSCPFFVNATMAAEFTWDRTLPPEMRDKMLKFNAPALLLGYIRPVIAEVTGWGPYNTIHIPFMDFTVGGKTVAPNE